MEMLHIAAYWLFSVAADRSCRAKHSGYWKLTPIAAATRIKLVLSCLSGPSKPAISIFDDDFQKLSRGIAGIIETALERALPSRF
jgi:hypothetical protein